MPNLEQHAKLCLASLMPLIGHSAWGDGFYVPDQGAAATAQAEAFAAQADDPSAIYYNMAGLTQCDGTQVAVGAYAIEFDMEFRGVDGQTDSNSAFSLVPHLYFVTDAGTSDWRVGLGVNNTFGLGVEWGEGGPVRSVVTEAELSIIGVSPTVAVRLDETLSLGASANIYYGRFERKSRPGVAPGAEGQFDLDVDGISAGGSVGVLWQPHERHTVAAVYRSRFDLEFSGTATLLGPGGAFVAGGPVRFRTTLPDNVTFGYAIKPTENLKLEFDLVWNNWESVDRLTLQSPDPGLAALPAERFEYRSAFSYRFGAEVEVNPTWTVRAGYGYFETATPDETYSPLVPDLDSHLFSFGFGYSAASWTIDLAFQFIYRPDRIVLNSVNSPAGTYEDLTTAAMATLSWRF